MIGPSAESSFDFGDFYRIGKKKNILETGNGIKISIFKIVHLTY